MNCVLTRLNVTDAGIFGELRGERGGLICVTLEHNYGGAPKLAPGTYTCRRHPPNRLPYETFMVEGVPDFQGQPVSGILLHIGNYDRDSEGCILLGSYTQSDLTQICQSKFAFTEFMHLQTGFDEFTLVVK